jgi:hypothetical protein
MWQVGEGTGTVHKAFRCGTLKKGGHLLDLESRREDDIKMDNQ